MGVIKRKGKGPTSFVSRYQLFLFAIGCLCIGFWNIQVAYHGTTDQFHHQQHPPLMSLMNGDRTTATPKENSIKVTWNESNYNTKILGDGNNIDHFDDNPDIPYNRLRTPTHTACQHTRGVYHIAIADRGGGVGTALFQLLIDQIIYAESQNLTPYIHLLPNVSEVIDDPIIFTTTPDKKNISFRAYTGPNLVPYVHGRHWRDIVPGPLNETAIRHTTQQQIELSGTGIWGHYFEPISSFVPGDVSCENKLYVTIGEDDMYLVIPGLHGYATASVRCWRYDFLPDYVSQPHRSMHTWLTPQRQRAARIVEKYFRFRPYLLQRAQAMNPNCSMKSNPCLGLHIRHSDKSAGRRVLAVSEFLPYCEQFVEFGGKQIYLATDSVLVLKEIQESWPQHIVSLIQSTSDMVRSSDTTAVFDMASHHRTNQEVLIEIIALSSCQFMVHGYSAVSEAAIWMNYDTLHSTSVNLEDEDHINITQYNVLLQYAIDGTIPKSMWPRPLRKEDLWPPSKEVESSFQLSPTHKACDGYDGVLLVSSVGRTSTTGPAFFTSIMNQLLYAERYNLKPFIHLNPSTSSIIYDDKVHNNNSDEQRQHFSMLHGMSVSTTPLDGVTQAVFPGQPLLDDKLVTRQFSSYVGNGIWNTYFQPVSDFVPGDQSCINKPLIEMPEMMITPGLKKFAPWSIKAWRYDGIPDILLKVNGDKQSMKQWLSPMRLTASTMVQKYFNFQPYIINRANEVNPYVDTNTNQHCLGVHIRLSDKNGKYRRIVKASEYLPYMEAFVKGGGRAIYIASDTQRPLQYMYKTFPKNITDLIRTQGDHIVRSTTGDWPTHILDDHHRVNSETLVDIVALSKCSILVHGYSTVSEAAIYINPSLHNNSVNLEDQHVRLTPKGLEMLTRYIHGIDKTLHSPPKEDTTQALHLEAPTLVHRDPVIFRQPGIIRSTCRTNAIIYLAQKVHSTYGRDSYGKLLRSLDLLYKNYLSINDHMNNTDIFIFHTGDFNQSDVSILEEHLGIATNTPESSSSYIGIVHLIDISGTTFWTRPNSNLNDDPTKDWYAYPLFSEGYRRMMHFFAIDIWDFFVQYNEQHHCKYRYLMRLDEDSYVHSPIAYDIFDQMRTKQYVYGYRMCAYEMKVTQRMSTMWRKRYPKFIPKREFSLDTCGFYNNFFVADLLFFQSPAVVQFLRFIDKQGHIYRRRLGDLMIHTMAVYWFAPQQHIHRFLDFTYEHGTFNETNGCLLWGGIQAGYNDPNAWKTISNFNKTIGIERRCDVNSSILTQVDLSPSYNHLPGSTDKDVLLLTITAGNVELPGGKGVLSG